MIRIYMTVLALTLSLVSQGCSREHKVAASAPSKPKHELYLEWHDKCMTDDTKVIDAHIEQFEAKLKEDPKDQLARAYLGSACALRAKASFWGLTKLKFLKRGQKLMDEAVTSAPDNPRVRLVRAIGSYKVPKRFDRRPVAVADFEKLVPMASKGHPSLQTNERQVILYYAWLTFKEERHKNADNPGHPAPRIGQSAGLSGEWAAKEDRARDPDGFDRRRR